MTEPDPFKSDPSDHSLPAPEIVRLEQGDTASFRVADAEPVPGTPPIMASPVIAKFTIGGTERTNPLYSPEELWLVRIDHPHDEDYRSLVYRAQGTDARPGKMVLLAMESGKEAVIKAAAFITGSGLDNVHHTYEIGRSGNTVWFDYGAESKEPVNPLTENPSVSRRHMRLWPSRDGRMTVFADGSNQTTVEATDIHRHQDFTQR